MDGQVFTHLPFAVFQVVFLPPGRGKCVHRGKSSLDILLHFLRGQLPTVKSLLPATVLSGFCFFGSVHPWGQSFAKTHLRNHREQG